MSKYGPVPLDQLYNPFKVEGWYRLIVPDDEEIKPSVGISSGGYPQIKVIFLVESGECEGNRVYHDILIPPVDKAYKESKNEATGQMYPDLNKPSFWMLKTGWALLVFGIDIANGDEMKNIRALQNEGTLQKVAAKMVLKHAVGYIVPEPYEKTTTDPQTGHLKTETRIKGRLKELRHADHKPEGGFVDDHFTPTVPTPTHAPIPAPPPIAEVTLDPDIDLEEDPNFLSDFEGASQ
jgi:hypothetical protein